MRFFAHLSGSDKASPSGSNGDDRRQRRKQGVAVGAAASRMRARAKQTLGAATRAVSPKVTERARMLTVIRGRGDSIALTKSLLIAAWAVLSRRACPLRRFAPALPKGEALAGRATSYWTPEARQDAKGRALLTGAAASGQRSLSSCRWPRQRSTAASDKSSFACSGES